MSRLTTATVLAALLALPMIGALASQAEVAVRIRTIWSKGVGELRIGDALERLQRERLVG